MNRVWGFSTFIGVAAIGVACGGQTGTGTQPDGGAGTAAKGGTAGTGGFGASGGTTVTGGTGGTVVTGGTGGGTTNVGQPPPPDPSAPPASGASPTTLAVRWISLGDIDRNGVNSPLAWRDFGFNVDGLISDKTQTNHCKAQAGGSKSAVQTDGTNGIDNSFGSNLVPIISALASEPSKGLNDAIANGEFTLLFHLKNLGPETSQNGVQSAYYVGSSVFTPPAWNGSDSWPVTAESLLNPGDVNTPKLEFSQSYVVNGVWVSGAQPTAAPLSLAVSVQGSPLPLIVHYPRVAMNLSGTSGQALGKLGAIGGVLDTEELIVALKKVAGSFDPNLCDGPTFDSIATQIRAGSDVMNDGTNGDPNMTCNGISIGVAFEASAVVLGGAAPPIQPAPDPCGG